MKRLNKKGFTLVELLAAIVILAVLMLVGAQAVAGIMRNSKANSLLSSLDMAAKQANTKLADGGLNPFDATTLNPGSSLSDVLNYNNKDYEVRSGLDSTGNYLITIIDVRTSASSFASVKCSHAKIKENSCVKNGNECSKNPDGDVVLKDYSVSTPGYYCEENKGVTEGTESYTIPLRVYKVEKVAN